MASRDVLGSLLVVALTCFTAFSAGASNAANPVAPLVGNEAIAAEPAILLAVGAISLGGFTIARRTPATVGDDITVLPIVAALIVSTIGAAIITTLSFLGIPASLAVSTTSCIIGLGWVGESGPDARRDRKARPAEAPGPGFTTGALKAPPTEDDETPVASPTVGQLVEGETPDPDELQAAAEKGPGVGEEEIAELSAESLFDPAATARIVAL